MIYLIYTAIIIEIIIAIAGIIAIIKFDKKINKVNETIVENRYRIKEVSKKIRTDVDKFCNAVKCYGTKMRQKRNSFILKLVKKFALTMGIQIFFKKYKKLILLVELVFIAYSTIKNSIKA